MKYRNSNTQCFANKVVIFATNHSNTLGLVRSLGEKGIKAHCVLCGNDPSDLVYDSKYPVSIVMLPTLDECLIHIIRTYSSEEDKPILLSTADFIASYIDQHSDELRDYFLIENAEKKGLHTELMDKMIIGKLAEECGLTIPRTIIVGKDGSCIKKVKYPCFTKASASIKGGKKEERVSYNESELREVLQSFEGDSLLVQQYIDKKTEYCLQGFSANGQLFIPYVMMYLRFSDSAFGGYVQMLRLRDKDLITKCENLIRKSHYTGLFSIEFIVDKNGSLFFTEVNLRNDGYSYFSTSGGANLPYLYCCCRAYGNVDLNSLKLKESYKAMNEGYDYQQSVVTGKISNVQYYWELIHCKSFIVFNWHDLRFVWNRIKRHLPFM